MPLKEDIEINGVNQKISFFSHVATVLDEKKWSRTEVSSSGGGGYVDRHGGYIHAPTISSISIQEQEAWFELEDASHYCMRLTNLDFSALPGHDVSIISVSTNGQNSNVGVLNRTTGKWHSFVNHGKFFREKIQSPPLPFLAYLVLVVFISLMLPSIVLSSLENINTMTNLKKAAESIEWESGIEYAEAGLVHINGVAGKAAQPQSHRWKKKVQEGDRTKEPDYDKRKNNLYNKLIWMFLLPSFLVAIIVWFLRGAKFNSKVANFSNALDDFVQRQWKIVS